MTRLRAAPLLALALTAGCGDGPADPQLTATVQILADAQPFDERTIGVGQTVRLTASPRDAAGRELAGRVVRWSSTAPTVATVDSAGLVHGVAVGTALVIATSDAVADTARINVAAPVQGRVECAPGQREIALNPGETYATNAWESGTLCFPGGVAGAEYLLIPFHAASAAGTARQAVELRAGGDLALATGALPASPAAATGLPLRDDAFHLRLRDAARPGLSQRRDALLAGPSGLLPNLSRAAAVPRVGDRMRINVQATSNDGCANPVYRTGRVVAVTTRAVIVADSANPAGGLVDADFRAFGAAFDDLIYPLGVQTFGEPSDVDGNGRAVIFFTSAVNQLTQPGSGYYIGGFFYDRDLFPSSGRGACEGSNSAEMFYLMVPDPAREAHEPVFSHESVRANTLAVIGHELQHLINASRRLHVNKVDRWEETWLNEGLSHVAEELLFFRSAGLTPRSNEDGTRVATGPGLQALRDYQVDNLERLLQVLRAPQSASPMGEDVLPTRGAIWAFLRYAADRRGGTEAELWRRLVDSRTAGLANLNQSLGTDAVAWMRDWGVALYLDDAGFATEPRHQQLSWNFRALYPRIRDELQSSGFGGYPLRTLRFEGDRALQLSLPAAASAFVRVPVLPVGRAAVRVTSGELPAPQKVQLTVVRIK